MKDFLLRLSSRKFLVAVGTAVALAANKQYEAAAGVVIAWLAAEGWIDVKAVRANKDAVNAELDKVLDEAEKAGE